MVSLLSLTHFLEASKWASLLGWRPLQSHRQTLQGRRCYLRSSECKFVVCNYYGSAVLRGTEPRHAP